MNPVTVFTSIGTTLATNALSNAKSPAQAIDDIMELVGFGMLTLKADKKRAKRQLELGKFIHQIANEMRIILPEDFSDPKLAIIGPALEASKYYIEEEDIRLMFAKIVASSVNSKFVEKVHPSFVEIIKQLSKADAIHLTQIKNDGINPFLNVKVRPVGQGGAQYSEIIEIFFLSSYYNNDSEYQLTNSSLNNLERLGLITFVHKATFPGNSYDSLENSLIILNLESTGMLESTHGFIKFTAFGELFSEICL